MCLKGRHRVDSYASGGLNTIAHPHVITRVWSLFLQLGPRLAEGTFQPSSPIHALGLMQTDRAILALFYTRELSLYAMRSQLKG